MNQQVLSGSSTVVLSNDVVTADMDGELAILNPATGKYYGLDPVGTRMWELMREPITVNHVRDMILEEYDVEKDSCERDLLALLQQLRAEGLVDIRNGNNP